jgi:mRNA interferase RelE/StbE
MQNYDVVLDKRAEKALTKLPARVQSDLVLAIDGLASEPRPHGLKTLDAKKKVYRIRAGSYRVVYQIQDARLVVLVVRVGDRKEIYKRLNKLLKATPPPAD